jgi:hypothetical protein
LQAADREAEAKSRQAQDPDVVIDVETVVS